jgi:cyanate permease
MIWVLIVGYIIGAVIAYYTFGCATDNAPRFAFLAWPLALLVVIMSLLTMTIGRKIEQWSQKR